HAFVGAVQVSAALAGAPQLPEPRLGLRLEIGDGAEVDRLGRACLRACGLEARLHPVVAERALLGGPGYGIDVDHAERARADAVAAAVARIRLDDDRIELRPNDGARRAHLQAARPDAVLADVAHHEPAAVAPGGAELLDEL